MSLRFTLFLFTFLHFSLADYTWPNPALDELEHITHVQTGLFGSGVVDRISSCKTRVSQSDFSEQSPADWLRTAFHDVVSHDKAAGTGGLDASIQWEINRSENRGSHAFIGTLQFLAPFFSKRTTMSDLLAMATYTAVRNCGDAKLTMKAGRIDAPEPAPEGRVPGPHESISELKQKFAHAGFDPKDMIQLVACGHTLGGVHKESFPEIVGNTTFSDFDKTEDRFDNRVAVEYLRDTTKNPLVRAEGGNNSDFKIFNSDGNSTIRAMSSPGAFAQTCEQILQRMIDTVPSTVTLSPLPPQTVKPYRLRLQLTKAGVLRLVGHIRMKKDDSFIKNVRLQYWDRNGNPVSDSIPTNMETAQGGVGKGQEANFYFYEIGRNQLDNGISKFNVVVTYLRGGQKVYDNNGNSYPIQDAVLIQESQSCLTKSKGENGIRTLTITAAVRSGLSTESVEMKPWQNPVGGYALYTGSYPLPQESWDTTFDVWAEDSNGTRYEDAFRSTDALPESCARSSMSHRRHKLGRQSKPGFE
ncbi:manganese peroxidase 2 [Ceratobasidium sp. AG-Ba]|nr:manganese peroxidase 2 [Ceratobasidium sp. AG-Ba]